MKLIKNDSGEIIRAELDYIPFNRHSHLRDDFTRGGLTETMMREIGNQYWGSVVMPNTRPAKKTTAMVKEYRKQIDACNPVPDRYTPFMTLYLTEKADLYDLEAGLDEEVFCGVKYYVAGATTNSDEGVANVRKVIPHLKVLAKKKKPLLIHGEATEHEIDFQDREPVFMDRELQIILQECPDLTVVLEHITTQSAVNAVLAGEGRVKATLTPQHGKYNRNALFDGGCPPYKVGLRPSLWCLPILKSEENRKAVAWLATSGNPNIGDGDDTAPHKIGFKYCECGCAGCLNSNTSGETYFEIFLRAGESALVNHFENFMCKNFLEIYGAKPKPGKFIITREKWIVPNEICGVTPLHAGQEMEWKARRAD